MSNFKNDVMRNAVKIQTAFNRDISDGWNILLSPKENLVEFIVLIDDGSKIVGKMGNVGTDVMIEWEGDYYHSLEGLLFGENLEEALTEMVALINIERGR